jgi:uncharacterized protein
MSKVVHFEIQANDMDAMKKFYGDAFGWEFQGQGEEYGGYNVIIAGPKDDLGINGGMMKRNMPIENGGVNSFTSIIGVENIDDTIAKLEAGGAAVQMPKTDVPGVGFIAYYKDPEGNMFGIIQPTAPPMA